MVIKATCLLYFALYISLFSFSQDRCELKIVDSSTYGKWPIIESEAISNDGNFISYSIYNMPVGESTFILKSVNNKVYKEFKNVKKASFSDNSNVAFILNSNDSLFVIDLLTDKKVEAANVDDYFVCSKNGDRFGCILKDTTRTLVIMDRKLTVNYSYFHVEGYKLSPNGFDILVCQELAKNNFSLGLLSTQTFKIRTIWNGSKPLYYIFDKTGSQILFSAGQVGGAMCIRYYRKKMLKSILLIDDKRVNEIARFQILPINFSFNKDGRKVIFTIYSKQNDTVNKNKVGSGNVTILTNKSVVIEGKKGEERQERARKYYKCVFDIFKQSLVRIEDDNISPSIEFLNSIGKTKANFIFGVSEPVDRRWFGTKSTSKLMLIDTNTGLCKMLSRNVQRTSNRSISPDEKFATWFEWDSLAYVSYEIATGIKRVLSRSVPYCLYDDSAFIRTGREVIFGLENQNHTTKWLAQDKGFIVYDRYDLWLLDPTGLSVPRNITKGYGRRNQIVFTVIDKSADDRNTPINLSDEILLAAYNVKNKNNGFWRTKISPNFIPLELKMEAFNYFVPRIGEGFQFDIFPTVGFEPIKAKYVNRWLVKRMSSSDFPNLFTTENFSHFDQHTNLQPQKGYNWINSELVRWMLPDGNISQGILYKPNNFDSSKSYPVIFNYYARRSDELVNKFIYPDYCRHNIDIPTFVSNGFLVFVPDIYYKQGHNGKSVVDCVLSAANYLSRYRWVDSNKLALQGHSFGGWETNFLVTHSTIWAAACEVAGTSNLVSAYGQINYDAINDRQQFYETFSQGSAFGLGVTPWTNPELYIENSPVFFVDRVKTPLLMMHNSKDRSVPFSQGMEFYLGLRRAEKDVWFLQYDDEDHNLDNNENAKDFTNKILSFFEYYLRNGPLESWMEKPLSRRSDDIGNYYLIEK